MCFRWTLKAPGPKRCQYNSLLSTKCIIPAITPARPSLSSAAYCH